MAPLSTLIPSTLQTARLTMRLFDKSQADYDTVIALLNAPGSKASLGEVGIVDRATFDDKHTRLFCNPAIFTKLQDHDLEVDCLLIWLVYLRSDAAAAAAAPATTTAADADAYTVAPAPSQEADPTGPFIGLISLYQRSPSLPPDIGFLLEPTYRRRGFGRELGCATLAFAQRALGMPAVMGYTTLDNAASQAVLGSLGMVRATGVKMQDRDGSVIDGACFVHPESARASVEGRTIVRGGVD